MSLIEKIRARQEARFLPLFMAESFRGVVTSLTVLFSTVFIYQLIFSWLGDQKQALSSVFAFFLILYSTKLLVNSLAENLSLDWGLKKVILFSQLGLALCLLAFFLAVDQPAWLIPAALSMGFAAGLFWFSRHSLMIKIGQRRSFGRQLGALGIFSTVLLMGTPLLGGALVNWGGYRTLFLVALAFVLVSFLSALKIGEHKTHQDTSLKEVLRLFKAHPRVFLAYFGNAGGAAIYSFAFPLYLFLILKEELSLGSFFSLAMLLTALISYLVGRQVDLKGKKGVLIFGSMVSCLVWLGRGLTQGLALLLLLDVLDRFTADMTGIPLSVLTYEKAIDGHSTGRAVLFMEMATDLGAAMAALLLLLFTYLNLPLNVAFFLAAALSLTTILAAKEGR